MDTCDIRRATISRKVGDDEGSVPAPSDESTITRPGAPSVEGTTPKAGPNGFYTLPRFVGNPIQTTVTSPEQFDWFIQMNNGVKDCFVSHNAYPSQGTLLNTFIPQDLDSIEKPENALYDSLKLYDASDTPLAAIFTGRKGFHIYSMFKPELIKDDAALKCAYAAFQNHQVQSAKMRTHDRHIIGDTRRMIRIPNTIHPKTGLYCVVIPWEMMKRADINEILEYAKTPQPIAFPEPVETFSEHYRRVKYKRERIAYADSGESEPTVGYHIEAVPGLVRELIPRKCIHQALLSHNPPHVVRFEAAASIARMKFPYSMYSGLMHDIAERAKWVDRHNHDRMEYQLAHIFRGGYEHPTSCEKLRSLSLCVGSACERFADEFPEDAAREAAQQGEHQNAEPEEPQDSD